jgi:hypothetical protein
MPSQSVLEECGRARRDDNDVRGTYEMLAQSPTEGVVIGHGIRIVEVSGKVNRFDALFSARCPRVRCVHAHADRDWRFRDSRRHPCHGQALFPIRLYINESSQF